MLMCDKGASISAGSGRESGTDHGFPFLIKALSKLRY